MKTSPLLFHLLLPFLYCLPFWFAFATPWMFGWFMIGVFLGFGVLLFDRFAHAFFLQPETEFSGIIRESWKARRFREVLRLLTSAGNLQEKLMTRSIMFLLAFVGLAIFVVTSTGSSFGVGIVLGIGLHFCLDFFLYRRHRLQFEQQFLWQLKRKLTEKEIDLVVIMAIGFQLFLSLMMFR